MPAADDEILSIQAGVGKSLFRLESVSYRDGQFSLRLSLEKNMDWQAWQKNQSWSLHRLLVISVSQFGHIVVSSTGPSYFFHLNVPPPERYIAKSLPEI